MPGRKYTQPNSSYRYGFNGKENDNEVKGEGNQQDYGMRIYDPRLGRFLSVDPITLEYPELTPYQFASNRPIDGIDLDGLEYSPAGRRGREFNYLATDATAVMHYPANPLIIQQQVAEAPERQRKIMNQEIQKKVRTQATAALKRYRKPDAIQQAKENNLKEAYEASSIPENHWTKNKYLNKFSENVVEPMVEMGIGEGVGKLAFKGISLLIKPASTEYGLAYRAINPQFAESTVQNGFYKSGLPGRLGNDGIYANNTIEGAIKEFSFHNPNVKPVVFEVKYPITKPLSISPPTQPSSYFAGPMPFTQGANILLAPSLRAPGTINLLIRNGAKVGAKTP